MSELTTQNHHFSWYYMILNKVLFMDFLFHLSCLNIFIQLRQSNSPLSSYQMVLSVLRPLSSVTIDLRKHRLVLILVSMMLLVL